MPLEINQVWYCNTHGLNGLYINAREVGSKTIRDYGVFESEEAAQAHHDAALLKRERISQQQAFNAAVDALRAAGGNVELSAHTAAMLDNLTHIPVG